MTKQEKNEICAKALGLKVLLSTAYKKPYQYNKDGFYFCKYNDWNPDENANQAMMLLDWLVERWGCVYTETIKNELCRVANSYGFINSGVSIMREAETLKIAIRNAVVAEMENNDDIRHSNKSNKGNSGR